ncbi:unnamed protein product [Urochloa decumbens]|uniref:Flavin-containing monooxygenase n=1 Tax=Urochloa decumbens TaxID=240449 RepID=A0ABC9AR07_9POAL
MVLLPTDRMDSLFSPQCVWVNGPIIVGAGPSGLAVAACLRQQGVPYVVLEAADCFASVNLPNQFRELPRMPFPDDYPEHITRHRFIDYLERYAGKFEIRPEFNSPVCSARYDETSGLWRVLTESADDVEYIGRWLIAANCKNTETVIPYIPGLADFDGDVRHVSAYKSGESYRGKRVLVVGCGRSGREVSLDLCDHGVHTYLVVRDAVHVLPGKLLGKASSDLAVLLVRWLPLWLANMVIVFLAWLVVGSCRKLGFCSPASAPLDLNGTDGRTMFLDSPTLAHIRAGEIDIVPAVVRCKNGQFQLIDGRIIDADAVILATGYRSRTTLTQWLQGNELFDNDGYPKSKIESTGRWKGQAGLYAVGARDRQVTDDAQRVAMDLGASWREETKPTKRAGACHRKCISVVF